MCVGLPFPVAGLKEIRDRTRDPFAPPDMERPSNCSKPSDHHEDRNIKHNSIASVSAKDDLRHLSKDELIEKVNGLRQCVVELEAKCSRDDSSSSSSNEEKLRKHQVEAQRRENILVMRLATREQEVQEILTQLEELRTSVGGGLRNALLDPVVNSMFQKMRDELRQTKEKYEQSQQELNAWKFTPDSQTGKRLMARCRSLIQENEELGRMIEVGRLARLEGELAMSRKATDELRGGQSEVEELLVELDDDMEGLQATVMYLQEQLEESRRENKRLRHQMGAESPPLSVSPPPAVQQRTPSPVVVQQNGSRTPQQEHHPDEHWTTRGLSPMPPEEAIAAATAVLDDRTELPPTAKEPKLDPETGDFMPQSPEVNCSLEDGEIEASANDLKLLLSESAKGHKRPRANARTRPRAKRARRGRATSNNNASNVALVLQNGLDVSDGSEG